MSELHRYLEAIFVADRAGAPMIRIAEAEMIASIGIEGDRYAVGTGYYSRADPCQVTLIEGEALDRIAEKFGISIHDGEHRRNLVTRGIVLRELKGCRFRVGEVLLEFDRPRPPCAYMERITTKGMTKALGEGAGIAARVIEAGWIRQGDAIHGIVHGAARVRRLP